ncbi:pH-sensitive chloride channel 2-like [Rhagoletis pomonella]|uniref:pH-sensitive chloride channel 2-like n=1 Tax=Rhagoletis pomonella TaxID=28610 RepID=UPI00177B7CC4|nr:pH-sensitive chloride channel 2-like [Rhagoletis pomonella]
MKFFFVVLHICVMYFSLVLANNIQEENLKRYPYFNMSDSQSNCPTLQNAESLTQKQLIFRLTSPCRYDRFERPCQVFDNKCSADQPLHIYVRIYVNDIDITDSSDLQLKVSGFLQLRYKDLRLAFGVYAPNRVQTIFGDTQLNERIWVPHLLLANEQTSIFLGTGERDVYTIIRPDGILIMSTRIQSSLSCGIALNKFPFDDQQCYALIKSWIYNSSEVILHWEDEAAIVFDQNIQLTHYALQDSWSNETVVQNRRSESHFSFIGGNYSTISFSVYLTRDSRFYTMAYFLPSMMLVGISWVSFWLQADQTPARTTLGTSTMLSLFTLTSYYEKQFQSISYPQFFEVWFFGCTFFIFGSLIEFAFVNTIWRRNQGLKLKKVNSKYIFKSTLTPKVIPRKNIYDCETDGNINFCNENNRELQTGGDVKMNGINANGTYDEKWSTMTPHEASLWIDRKARFVFPLSYIIFNAIYWTLIFSL